MKDEWFKKREKMSKIKIKKGLRHSLSFVWLIFVIVIFIFTGIYLISYNYRIIYSLIIQIFGVLLLSLWTLLEKYTFVLKFITNFVGKHTPFEGTGWKNFDKWCRTTGLGLLMAGLIVELSIALK